MNAIDHLVAPIVTLGCLLFTLDVNAQCTKAFVNTSCAFTVDQSAILSTSPSGPLISCSGNGNGTKTCTITWKDDGTYSVGIKPEPDQPIVPFTTVTVYWAVTRPTVSGPSLVCASASSSDYSATTSNDSKVDDFTWAISPSNAYTSFSRSGSPNGANMHVNWNTSYTGNVTLTATSHGFGEDQLDKTFSVNRHAMENFTASISLPPNACEGSPFNLFANVSHINATFDWYLEDINNNEGNSAFSHSQTVSVTPTVGTFYRLKATPSSSNECLTNYSAKWDDTRNHSFQVTPRLNSVDITNDLSFRCNAAGTLGLTFQASGPYTHVTWSVASNNSTSAGSVAGSTLTWNPDFVGTATLTANVTGCNGVISDTKDVVVAATPPHKSLLGPGSPLCPNTTALISLNNTSIFVPESYQLFKVNNPGQGETTTPYTPTTTNGWNVGPGTYYVKTTALNCPTDISERLNLTSVNHSATFSVANGTTTEVSGVPRITACDGSTVTITVGEATNLEWYQYSDNCKGVDFSGTPSNEYWDHCHTRLTAFDGHSQFPFNAGSISGVVIKGTESTCNVPFEKRYDVVGISENRIRTLVPQQAVGSPESVVSDMTDPFKVKTSDAYFDGLGRSVFNVQYFGSRPDKDAVELKTYDPMGREAVKLLPFAMSHSFDYPCASISERQAAFYSEPPAGVQSDDLPFAKTNFEPSPLNRVIEQGAPGTVWQPGTGRTVMKDYTTNAATDVLLFTYDHDTEEVKGGVTYYKENTLHCTKTKDEMQNDVLEYIDNNGRVVCKKVKASENEYACTYYVYDDLGNLVTVLPPQAIKTLSTN